jgi:uncharacterized protein involved in exopolysaccharide biosynthesis
MMVNTQQQFAFRVLDAAEPPPEPNAPRRLLMALAAGFMGGGAAVFGVLLKEGVARRTKLKSFGMEQSLQDN